MTSKKFHLILLANSPGELTAWVEPILIGFRNCCDFEATILLTPCQFATGNEKEISQTFPNVKKVYSPRETMILLCSLKAPFSSHHSAILLLGSDPLYALILSLRTKIPIFSYAEKRYLLHRFFKAVYYKKDIGNLMTDRGYNFSSKRNDILTRESLPEDPFCLVFIGSRKQHFDLFFPLIIHSLIKIIESSPDVTFVIQLSPFLDKSIIERCEAAIGNHPQILLRKENALDLLSIAKFLITIPGTNTMEAAVLNVPMLVLVPTNFPEALILDGILGLLSLLPIVGKWVKRLIVFILKHQKRFYALPNIVSKKAVVPELSGHLSPSRIRDTFNALYWDEDKLSEIKNNLAPFRSTTSVAQKIATEIINEIKHL